jgi:hypothetical protein
VDSDLDKNSLQNLHRKIFLRGYLNKLCSEPSKIEFWGYLEKVGMMHVGQGQAHALHIEYVYVGVTVCFVQDFITEAVLSHLRLKMDLKIALVKVVHDSSGSENEIKDPAMAARTCSSNNLVTSPSGSDDDDALWNGMKRVNRDGPLKDRSDAKDLPSACPVAHSAIPRVTRTSIVS